MAIKTKRSIDRWKKRVMVRFGVDRPDKAGFTKNVSKSGLHIQTNNPIRPGTTIQLEMKFPEKTFSMWARVIWAKKVPPQLAHSLPCGMGLQFIDPSEEWSEYYLRWRGAPK